MKRYFTPILIILVLTSGVLVACGQKASSTEIYQNEKYGYSLEIPKTWTIKEERSGQTVTFRSSHDQMEIIVKVDSEEALNDFHSEFYSEARSRSVDVEDMTPLELVVRANETDQAELGGEGKRIDWNEHAITTLFLIKAEEWKSWVKTCFIVDKGYFYIIAFKVLGYSDSEFEGYRNQINAISKTFHIEGSTVINLPEGKTIFDF